MGREGGVGFRLVKAETWHRRRLRPTIAHPYFQTQTTRELCNTLVRYSRTVTSNIRGRRCVRVPVHPTKDIDIP
jgi:hypothetical protein